MEKEANNQPPTPAAQPDPARSLEELSRQVRLALLGHDELTADERTRGFDPYNSRIGAAASATGRRR